MYIYFLLFQLNTLHKAKSEHLQNTFTQGIDNKYWAEITNIDKYRATRICY